MAEHEFLRAGARPAFAAGRGNGREFVVEWLERPEHRKKRRSSGSTIRRAPSLRTLASGPAEPPSFVRTPPVRYDGPEVTGNASFNRYA